MAIRKQNQILWFLVLIIFLILFAFWKKSNELPNSSANPMDSSVEITTNTNAISAVDAHAAHGSGIDEVEVFAEIVADLGSCMMIAAPSDMPMDSSISADSIVLHLQEFLGPAEAEKDKWKEWDLELPDEREVRMRLELVEKVELGFERTLYEFPLAGLEGELKVENDPEKIENSTDENIGRLIRRGKVIAQRRAAFIKFESGERLDFIEQGDRLVEIEFTKGENAFRCENLRDREACRCLPAGR